MKRFLSTLILISLIMIVFCVPAGAESNFLSMQYVPRTQRGTMFYLDISCDMSIGAAMFTLEYDSGAAEFRSVDCDDDNASAMAEADGDSVKLVYSHRAGADGKLFRLAFKALRSGDTGFTLHVTQAVDGELNYLTDLSDCSVSVSLGREDVEAGASVPESGRASASPNSSEKSSKKSFGGSKSSVSQSDDDAESEAIDAAGGVFRDLSGADNTTWFILGGAVVIFAGLLVTAGVFIGKRMKKSPKPEPADADDGEVNDAPEDPIWQEPFPQPPEEDVFRE